jgi:hypothetical protein
MNKLASQANLCYNEREILLCSENALTLSELANLIRRLAMDMIPQDNTPRKQCTGICERMLPLTREYFSPDKRSKDELQSKCKQCSNIQKKAYAAEHKEELKRYRANHREERLAYNHAYYAEHRKEISGQRKGYYQDNQEHLRAYSTQYRAEHPEKVKEGYTRYNQEHQDERRQYRARYNAAHRAERKIYRSTWHEANKEHERAYGARYNVQHRAERRAYDLAHREHRNAQNRRYRRSEHGRLAHRTNQNNRRVRQQAILGFSTPQQIEEQLKRQHYRCYYAACGHAKFERVKGKYVYHIDHTYPLSRVIGTDIPANDMSYLVLACPSCNTSKNNKFPWEWVEGGRLL